MTRLYNCTFSTRFPLLNIFYGHLYSIVFLWRQYSKDSADISPNKGKLITVLSDLGNLRTVCLSSRWLLLQRECKTIANTPGKKQKQKFSNLLWTIIATIVVVIIIVISVVWLHWHAMPCHSDATDKTRTEVFQVWNK